MKRNLILLTSAVALLLGAFLCLGGAQADPCFLTATGNRETDWANVNAALAPCIRADREIVLNRGIGTAFKWNRPLVVKPIDGETMVKTAFRGFGRGLAPVVEYDGPAGTSAFVFYGLKHSDFSVNVRVLTPAASAVWLSTKDLAQSTSANRFHDFTIGLYAGQTKGILVGPDGPGHGDISCNIFDNISISGIASAPARFGIGFTGGNTLANECRNVYGYNHTEPLIQFWANPDMNPSTGGGDAWLLANCGTSGPAGLVRSQGGFHGTVLGGRSETVKTGAVVTSGAGGGAGGYINVIGHVAGACPVFKSASASTPIYLLGGQPAASSPTNSVGGIGN